MSYFNGSLRVFYNRLVEGDKIADGDGLTLLFNKTFYPCVLGSTKVRYTIASVPYEASETAGAITGTYLTGTIDEDGVVALTFTAAPDDDTEILIDYYAIGVLERLKRLIVTEADTDTLGTGDGVTTHFTKTVTNTPISKGQLRVRFAVGTTEYYAWSDADGKFVHALIDYDLSSVDEATGDVDITFLQPIDDLYVMAIDYIGGGAVEGEDWFLQYENTTREPDGSESYSGEDLQEVILKNCSLNYSDYIVIGLREFKHEPSALWGWNLNIYDKEYTSWNGNYTFHGRTGYDVATKNYLNHPMMPAKDDVIEYFFFVNKRRIVIVLRNAGTIYTSCYVGGGIRYASPARYPLPMLAAGNVVGNVSYNDVSDYIRSFYYHAFPNAFMLISPASVNLAPASVYVEPVETFQNSGTLKASTLNKSELYQLVFVSEELPDPQRQTLFLLDDVCRCPDNSLIAEDELTVGADVYKVFQDVFRTTYKDYFCVKEA